MPEEASVYLDRNASLQNPNNSRVMGDWSDVGDGDDGDGDVRAKGVPLDVPPGVVLHLYASHLPPRGGCQWPLRGYPRGVLVQFRSQDLFCLLTFHNLKHSVEIIEFVCTV